MRRSRRLVLCAVLTVVAGSASRAQYFDWAVGFGPQGFAAEFVDEIFVDGVGNLYLVGQFSEDADFDLGPDTFLLDVDDQSVFVAKYTSDGDLFWAARFGGAAGARVWPGGIAADNRGNVYVTGYFEGTVDFDPGPGTVTLTAASGALDAFVTKLNSSGGLLWARRQGGSSSFNEGHTIALDGSGNVYTAGHFSGTSDFNPGAGVFNLTSLAGTYAAYVLRLDGAGNFGWAQGLGGTGSAFGYGLAFGPGPGGHLHLVGHFQGTVDFDPGAGVANMTSVGNADAFVAKLDTTGGFVWARQFGGALGDTAVDVAVDPSGVYTTGQFRGTVDFDPGLGVFNLTAGGTQDAYVSKLDNAGALAWARQLGGAGSQTEEPCGVAVDGAGHPHVAGSYQGTADFDPGAGTYPLTATAAGGNDVFVVELDGAGAFQWAGSMGGSCEGTTCSCCSNDRALGVAVTPAGHTYTVGYFRGRGDYDPSFGTEFFLDSGIADDMFLSKLSPVPLSGAVPDGASSPGTMLTLRKGAGSDVIFQWGASCRPGDTSYALYEGALGTFTSHVPLACTVFGTSVSGTPGAGNRYYLVVPSEDTFEGSYGVDGDGNERLPSAAACRPQSFDACGP